MNEAYATEVNILRNSMTQEIKEESISVCIFSCIIFDLF